MSSFPPDWEVVPLREVAAARGGASFSPAMQGRASGDLPFYKVSDMNLCGNEVRMSRSTNWVMRNDLQNLRAKTLPPNATIFPKVGGALHTNKKRLLSREAVVDNNVMGLVTLNPERCRPEFLFAWFQTINLSLIANAGPLPSLNASQLYELLIPLPGDAEQQAISRVLDLCGKGLSIERVAEATAIELKHATMRELFTRGLRGEAQKETPIGLIPQSWTLNDFADMREWLQYGTSIHCSSEAGKYPVLRIPNIEPGRVASDELKYCNLSDDEANKYKLSDGDLIFIRTNGVLDRLGACAVYAGSPENALFASYLIRARLKESVEPKFVSYFYASTRGTSLIAGRATPAADGKYNLNTGTIDSLPLPIPGTLAEQREIVAVLDALDRKVAVHKKRRAALERLFDTLLHKFMTGEIRTRELDLSILDLEVAQ